MKQKKLIKYIVYILIILGVIFIFVPVRVANPLTTLILASPILILIVLAIRKVFCSSKKEKDMPDASQQMEKHYEDLGMSEQQTAYFRETMATTKKQVIQLEKNMSEVTKLKSIDLRNDTVKAAKAMFKELVKEPTKLHYADGFLYNHLPNLVDLTSKYIEINNHEIKTKNTFEALEKSASVIDEVSKLLVSDYERFMSDDIEELEVEITLAEQHLSREQLKKEEKEFAATEEEEI